MSRKPKYTVSFKMKAVRRILNREISIRQLSISLGINPSMIRRWVSYYDLHGKSGLTPHNNLYTPKFKLAAIKAYQEQKLSLGATCYQFHIPSISILSNWLVKYEQNGEAGLIKETRGRKAMAPRKPPKKKSIPLTREQELEKQLEYLKLENQYLKKLHALIQQEELQKNKKQS